MNIAVLKSTGSSERYAIPLSLIQNVLAPFFLKRGWTVAKSAVIENSVSYIMLTGDAESLLGVIADFEKHVQELTRPPKPESQNLFGVEYPSLYLRGLTLLTVLGSSDLDDSIFAGYLMSGLLENIKKMTREVDEDIRDIGRKFKNF